VLHALCSSALFEVLQTVTEWKSAEGVVFEYGSWKKSSRRIVEHSLVHGSSCDDDARVEIGSESWHVVRSCASY